MNGVNRVCPRLWAERPVAYAVLGLRRPALKLVTLVAGVLLYAVPCLGGSKTCLTGTDPSVAADAAQIKAVRSLIDAACICSNFDGSPGKAHSDYVKCAATIIKSQVAASPGALRSQCKGAVTKYYVQSTCGMNPAVHAVPCIKTVTKRGKVACAIKSTTKKDGVTPSGQCANGGTFTQAACPLYTTCIDAADTNHDLIIAAPGDTGACAPTRILSAFFGLDNALPATAGVLCPAAVGKDGMPVTFSRRVTLQTPAASAFRITTRSGATHFPLCATLLPAVGSTERNTVLLMGEFGDDPGDPPLTLDIFGSVPLDGGEDAEGLSSPITPLAAGPSLVLAIAYASAELPGSSCPSGPTQQIVQTTWSGGVTAVSGGELADAERLRMHVTLADGDGGTHEVTPFAIADVGDHDNYVQLCLDDVATPVSVRVEAGTCVDPRGDLNDATTVAVTRDR